MKCTLSTYLDAAFVSPAALEATNERKRDSPHCNLKCSEGGIEIGTLGSRGAKAGVEERNDGSNSTTRKTRCIKKKQRAAGKLGHSSFNQ